MEPQTEKVQPTSHKVTAKDFIEKRDYTGALTVLKVYFLNVLFQIFIHYCAITTYTVKSKMRTKNIQYKLKL